ncbi:PREDICTED: E3 ubiquitin-protein ligase UPL6 [Brassica oleracea var. oleracea]|uniref:HECT-type E3 ubiquitin transferase n=1 Tax=Brassica oleracea var. oleracea TaxID=109376 RepID=A0A0D3ACW5_BRAOL|nr:PREDICTED: E3 ubiquitin-protein ligase UPL6 [Brassica oleracea var. oleracea]
MFFSGDPSTRKRVDLGGRSTKEGDARRLLEQTRMERNRRLQQKQHNSAALKIQKFFRGRRSMAIERFKVRRDFCETYGDNCQNVDRHCFEPASSFLPQFLFFFKAQSSGDFVMLVETCRLLRQFAHSCGDILSFFSGLDYSTEHNTVDFRVKKLAFTCIEAIHQNRERLRDQLLVTPEEATISTAILMDAMSLLLDPKLPWVCKIVSYLQKRNIFKLVREIVTTAKEGSRSPTMNGSILSLESVLFLVVPHVGREPCCCPVVDPRWSFSSMILTIPFIWQLFPNLKVVFANPSLSQHYVHQMALCIQKDTHVLPIDTNTEFPGYACLLGNTLEIANVVLSQPECSLDMAIDIASVATFLLETLPPIKSSERESRHSSSEEDDDMLIDDVQELVLNRTLEQQITTNAIDSRFLLQLTNILFHQVSGVTQSYDEDKEALAIGTGSSFLYAAFNILPLERIMTVMAYRTELVAVLWNYMKRCHENQKWSSMPSVLAYLPADSPGWLLPLVVFCPVYKHMLTIVDNEEFYERGKPLSLQDIRLLIIILKQALWQLLWVNPLTQHNSGKSVSNDLSKKNRVDLIQNRVGVVVAELLSQFQDWNNRQQFTSSTDFQADTVREYFITQAIVEGTRASYILMQAPFLIPFTSRVKIFTTQLATARQSHGSEEMFAGNRFRIRRDHILDDAYNQMSALSEDDLRGPIRVTFVNELGVEEAGIDGGGIFKDFMEKITLAAFDVQYGLFKETADHMLYPNPGSGMIHGQHLHFFHFLGSLLAKAMFEGILVDIPFATFFVSKLKQKYNYLNDLPSLDPELYRHLIFLKRYKGDISDLELYFVILNNEYGERTEEELLPGGKDMRVTNKNVITFIHLVSNHRLNFQIRQQSSHFLRGFQQLIPREWIDMFNEHELQVLISGSADSLDIDDLRENTNYSGGYNAGHYVIDMFWEVMKSFSTENQKKFLKFVTGCSRGPLLGFKYLEPAFCIQRAGGSVSNEAVDRLPTSATCMNLLKLPPYQSKEQLETKLMYAISAEAGFDLS